MNEKAKQNADFRIDANGHWYHDGALIKREALAKLFSDRALKIDEDGLYWLQTPYEKYAVDVEDVPYLIVDYEDNEGAINFRTNMKESITLNEEHPLELRAGIPYIEVRNGLYAKIARSVYYNLVEEYGQSVQGFKLG